MADIIQIGICDGNALISFLKNDLKFDLDVVNELDVAIQKLYQENIFDITIDFKTITFITSLVLGKLVSYHRDLSQRGGRLAITNTNDSIMDVFTVTRLDRVIAIS